VLYEYQVEIPGISPLKIFEFNAPSKDTEKKDSHFHTRTDAINLDICTEHILMTALLDMIERYDAGPLLIITCTWNFFIKRNVVKINPDDIFIYLFIYL